MHLIDSLSLGGAESMAVNFANGMPRVRYRAYLCTTRSEGPLAAHLQPDVGRLRLNRRWRFDLSAIHRLVSFTRSQKIDILHAHSSTLFIGVVAASFSPWPAVVWHVHSGRSAIGNRSPLLYRVTLKRASAVIAVNQALAQWATVSAHVPARNVSYIPNFTPDVVGNRSLIELPGTQGLRIACVANLRPEKDHLTLLRAMAIVCRAEPAAHLILVGANVDAKYYSQVQQEITRLRLTCQVTWLGARQDVAAILTACDIGVLSSVSEGLPLALLEYGMVGLSAIATRVGQCTEVLDDQQAGLLVEPGDPGALAEAVLALLKSPGTRIQFGQRLRARVRERYSANAVMAQVEQVYSDVLAKRRERHPT